MKEQSNVSIDHEATETSVSLKWNIIGDTPKAIKIFRTSPTEQLLAHLTPEQFTATNTYHDKGLTPETAYSYLVQSEYDDGTELTRSITVSTIASSPHLAAAHSEAALLTARTLSVHAESDSCGSISVYWGPVTTGASMTVYRSDRSSFPVSPPLGSPWTDHRVVAPHSYTYSLQLSNGDHGGPSNSATATACFQPYCTYMSVMSHAFSEGTFGSFAFLVPLRDRVIEYLHERGEIIKGPWRHAHRLNLPSGELVDDTSLSLLQSSLGNLEAIVRVTTQDGGGKGTLLGYEFGQSAQSAREVEQPAREWTGPFVLRGSDGPFDGVTGSQALIESERDERNQFELLFPRGPAIFHYTHTIETITGEPWTFVAELPRPEGDQVQVASIALIQSSPRELAAIARISFTGSRNEALFIYVFNSETGWQGPFALRSDQGPIDRVTGSHVFIRSGVNTFELLVPREQSLIFHYRLENQSFLEGTWRLVATLKPPSGEVHPISLAIARNTLGHLQVAAREQSPHGEDFFVGYVYNQDDGTWQGPSELRDEHGQPITAADNTTHRERHRHYGDDDDDRDIIREVI